MIKYLSDVKSPADWLEWGGNKIAPAGQEVEVFKNALKVLEGVTDLEILMPAISKVFPAMLKLNVAIMGENDSLLGSWEKIQNLPAETIPEQWQLYKAEKARRDEEKRLQEAKERHQSIVNGLNYRYPVPDRFSGKYNPHTQGQLKAWERFGEIMGDGVIFYGKPGTGKSHLLAGCVNELHEMEKAAIYVPVSKIIGDIKRSFGDNKLTSKILHDYQEVAILAIDDLGTEQATDWAASQLFEIIDSRYANNKPIMATSNLTPLQLGTRYGERLYSRIVDMVEFVEVTGGNIRLRRAK
ncbi:hypothetical protein SELR_25410 [Selenomonas ruminantium subsp. lactilytica TAM6421]|uniref:IstB-like ATP-binding domain-containing protein n=1 Tax=Selenomonas ruminantium subsp. lactilytica (strain NBRC 103574 / TAM6421) TaxID=927704 RepID=I0GU12_SELRL|nr:ATP-binding protein [Selenomonas ruminantium]BAL84249.1 hypothetical protein SELR_25410 [Selenomonas ruminantium subsp. lactilytica TAM6421]